MKKTPTKDIAASVRARLLRLARERGEDFQLVLTRYANERLLFRLASSPRETVVAEKLEAMVQLGMANSRMKDFYDLLVLARTFDFDGDLLTRAIRATFERRKTPLPTSLPVALTATFADDPTKKTQWSGFVRKAGIDDAGGLAETVAAVANFAEKPLLAAAGGSSIMVRWRAPGPWR